MSLKLSNNVEFMVKENKMKIKILFLFFVPLVSCNRNSFNFNNKVYNFYKLKRIAKIKVKNKNY